MTLLEIAKAIAASANFAVPITVTGADPTNRDMINFRQFANDTANELERRVDWASLRKQAPPLVGTGAAITFTLPPDFSRLTEGNTVISNGQIVRGGISFDEWQQLPAATIGQPRYYLLSGNKIQFWPALSLAATAIVTYQSLWWNTSTNIWVADADIALLKDDLILKGTIYRWIRHNGQQFQDHMAEYEAALTQISDYDMGSRSP